MAISDWVRFVALAAIWGGSFALLRVLAPVLGAVPTACLRVIISGSLLVSYFLIVQTPLNLKQNFKHYLIMGLLNAAIPFLSFAFAALHIPAGLSVILNSTAPLMTIILSAVFLAEPLTLKRFFGFVLGLCGVALIAIRGEFVFDEWSVFAIFAGLCAALSYAVGGIYIRLNTTKIDPSVLTGVSQFMGGLILLPFAAHYWIDHPLKITDFTPLVIFCLLSLSLVCSAFAFIVFYKLINRVGPSKAITVGYLMPVFGIFWGVLLLNETLTLPMIMGSGLIFLGIHVSNKVAATKI